MALARSASLEFTEPTPPLSINMIGLKRVRLQHALSRSRKFLDRFGTAGIASRL
jgi:hypothetical protein